MNAMTANLPSPASESGIRARPQEPSLVSHVRPAVTMLLLLTLLTGIVYPFLMLGLAQALVPWQAIGSIVEAGGKPAGSSLIGQSFTGDRYFHGRPSATTGTDPNDASKSIPQPYNASNSMGSNLGPIAQALGDRMRADASTLRAQSGAAVLPADAVTASASGLDPDISPAFALLQVPRVAKARGLSEEAVRRLLQGNIEPPLLGFLGEPHVNVLRLNVALDAAAPAP